MVLSPNSTTEYACGSCRVAQKLSHAVFDFDTRQQVWRVGVAEILVKFKQGRAWVDSPDSMAYAQGFSSLSAIIEFYKDKNIPVKVDVPKK